MDFVSGAAMVGRMDEDRVELIRRLCTEAGMIFEDASAAAILIGRVPAEDLAAAIAGLQNETNRASAFFAAAAAIAHQPQLPPG